MGREYRFRKSEGIKETVERKAKRDKEEGGEE